MKKDG